MLIKGKVPTKSFVNQPHAFFLIPSIEEAKTNSIVSALMVGWSPRCSTTSNLSSRWCPPISLHPLSLALSIEVPCLWKCARIESLIVTSHRQTFHLGSRSLLGIGLSLVALSYLTAENKTPMLATTGTPHVCIRQRRSLDGRFGLEALE